MLDTDGDGVAESEREEFDDADADTVVDLLGNGLADLDGDAVALPERDADAVALADALPNVPDAVCELDTDDERVAFEDADADTVVDLLGNGLADLDGDAVPLPDDRVVFVPVLADVPAAVVARARPGDLVLTLGAGDITDLAPQVLALLGAGDG